MPTTRVTRTLAASPGDAWELLANPWQQVRWWPRVVRIEDVAEDRFTQVLGTARGKGIRADFRVLDRAQPRLLRWEQELPGTPFQRILAEAVTTVELAPADGDGTVVAIELRQRLQGWSRLVPFLFRRAARRQLRDALAALDEVLSPPI
ncbi:MAG TPA: SRPBCC family protein [Conexibacter sp.]|nr:SRPBCC family protein [Conexibacter sp.]